MGERIDEAKGNIKEGAGKLTGNRRLEDEGRGEKTIARTRRKVKGGAEEIKGRVQEGVGRATGDERQRTEGTAERAKGRTRRTP